MKTDLHKKEGFFPYLLILIFLFNEYARPILFAKLKLALVIQAALVIYIFADYQRKLECLRNGVTKKYFALIVLMILHIFIAKNNFWAFETSKILVSYFIIYVSILFYVDTRSKYFALILIFLGSNFYSGVIGSISGGKVIGNGFMADENDFSLVMNMAFPISFYIFLLVKKGWRYFFLLSSIVFFVAGVLSLSRGGMVGIATVLMVMFFYSKKKSLFLAFLLLFVIIFSINMPDEYKGELLSIFEQGGSRGTGRERLEFWKVSTRMFFDNPIVGVGQGNIPWRLSEYQGDRYWVRGIGGRAVHSFYFTILPELGLVGSILIFLLIKRFFSVGKYLRQRSDLADDPILQAMSLGLGVSMIAFLVTGAFLSVAYYPHLWIFMPLMFSLYNLNLNKNGQIRWDSK